MGTTSFLSIRVPAEVRNRVKTIAARRGEKVQDLIGGLILRFLDEQEQTPPQLGEILRRVRELEPSLRAQGVAALFVFGSVARGEAGPDSDVDLAVEFAPHAEPSLLDIARLRTEIEEAIGHKVDLGERRALLPGVAAADGNEMVRAF
jgi:predicted nucleotidyltransferase